MIPLLVAALFLQVEPEIHLREGRFVVRPWITGAEFAVYVGGEDAPPMLGTSEAAGDMLTFRPRFAPSPGTTIRAVVKLPDGRAVERAFQVPAVEAAPGARVEHVYPSADVLPANQLKFYIHFSAPMRRGEAWQHLRLLDAKGAAVDLPFLEIDEELWDREQRRLTVLFDPGRLKRGVLPLEEAGPAIVEGGHYTLAIAREWRDARGLPLREPFRKAFRAAAPVREPVDPAAWELTRPAAGTRDPLTVEFPNSLDHALALRLISVVGPGGRVAGETTLTQNETRWQFVPKWAWEPGGYKLAIDSALEDLAGNKVGRPFDVDTFDPISKRMVAHSIELPFRVAPR